MGPDLLQELVALMCHLMELETIESLLVLLGIDLPEDTLDQEPDQESMFQLCLAQIPEWLEEAVLALKEAEVTSM